MNACLPEPQPPREETPVSESGEVELLRAGNAAVTADFVRTNVTWMLAVARRILRDEGHAEDAVQNAFVKIFGNLDSFEGRSGLKTWMHRILVNEALTVFRRNRTQKDESIDEWLPVFDDNGCRIEAPWANFETPEQLLQRTQTKAHVAAQIDKLPDAYRVVLVLRDIEEMTTGEVANALELSEANVKVRLHRARAALKKLLEPLIRGQEL
ncbi:sigma-70 family RNA polymerase sigma factor [Pelagibius sp. Alg239-R121]|uniref:sigma-70 family RNA polymerase sigma factor n=1 Tax=Pelagibius sp. Alg239-R121 TaxID=2993448 RepID=UPI0024A744D6|nr:sigma-70 family RNA polymerase sigma factor [Pelagibius sp. Alg239-R121]